MNTLPAIALLEFDSIAVGVRAADAMVKKAPIDLFRIGTVHPGKYLVLVGGSVASVDESHREGLTIGGDHVTDEIFLPAAHPQVVSAVSGFRRDDAGDALGILETSAIPSNIAAADKAVKTANVTIIEIRLGDGLGGKGVTFLTGLVHDVEAAVEAGISIINRPDVETHHRVIPIQHGELRDCIRRATEFHSFDASASTTHDSLADGEKRPPRTPSKRNGRR